MNFNSNIPFGQQNVVSNLYTNSLNYNNPFMQNSLNEPRFPNQYNYCSRFPYVQLGSTRFPIFDQSGNNLLAAPLQHNLANNIYDYSTNKIINPNTKIKRKKSTLPKELRIKHENEDTNRFMPHIQTHLNPTRQESDCRMQQPYNNKMREKIIHLQNENILKLLNSSEVSQIIFSAQKKTNKKMREENCFWDK